MLRYIKDFFKYSGKILWVPLYFLTGFTLACVMAYNHFTVSDPETVVVMSLVTTVAWPLVLVVGIFGLPVYLFGLHP